MESNQMLYENIAKLCSDRNISVRKLETELNFSNGMINGWKHNNPRLDSLMAVCRYFQVSMDALVGFNPIGR